MAVRQPDGSIRMADGRTVYANSLILAQDLCEIVPLCVPPPAWPFVSGGGGVPGPQGPPGPPGPPGSKIDLFAATRIVSNDPTQGTDLTIAAAIAALPPEGGDIYVKEGVYSIPVSLALPNKPTTIRGAGKGATILDIGSNAISLFLDLFDQPRHYAGFTALGNGGAGQVFMQFGSAPQADFTVTVDDVDTGSFLVAGTEIETTFLVDPAGFPSVLAQNCQFLLPNTATSLWWKGGSGSLTVTNCILASWDHVVLVLRRGGCTGAPSITSQGSSIGFENNAVAGPICHISGTYFFGFSGTSTLEIGNFSDIEGGIINDGTLILNRLCTVLGMLITLDQSIGVVRSIDIPAAADSCRISNCFFVGATSEAVRVASPRNIISDNDGCNVTEIGTANNNSYPNNDGFTGSTIIGPTSLVNNEAVFNSIGSILLTGVHRTVTVDASGGPATVALPTAASVKWIVYTIKKIDASANPVTIDPAGGETIDGALTRVLGTRNDGARIQSDGTTWWVIGTVP